MMPAVYQDKLHEPNSLGGTAKRVSTGAHSIIISTYHTCYSTHTLIFLASSTLQLVSNLAIQYLPEIVSDIVEYGDHAEVPLPLLITVYIHLVVMHAHLVPNPF